GPSIDIAGLSPPVNTNRPSVSTANESEEQLFEKISPFKNAFSLPPVPNISSMDNTGIFGNAYDDEDVEEKVDMNNVISSYTVPDTSFTKFHKNHPEDQVIGSLKTHVQTRHMTKINEERGLISLVHKLNHKDLYNCLFACFLSQMELKKLVQALKDPNWVEAMQDELLQFKLLKGHTQEEGIDYDEVFARVARIESIRLFLAYASFKDFVVYQMDKSDGIFISQDKYVAEILKKFDFASVKTANTPMETNKALVKDEEVEDVDVHLYRLMIGSLMYLTASRPDIMFAVCACARFQVTPKTSHFNIVKMIFRYLKGQPKLGLWYPRDSPFDLEAFSDSDYAGASLDRKSTTGGCQFLGKRLISWQCKKQTIVANSTTEVEYVVAANYYRHNLVFHSKTKHIEIRHHFIRDSYEKKLIQVIKIHTDQNVADLLTKAFDASRVKTAKVDDKDVHKELGDRMERAATTASSLEAEQDSGSGPWCQDTILGDVVAQTRFETTSK
ncbi:putative ribonuclease H-like domain-containing protein, partial [Tanacetum coccineum]